MHNLRGPDGLETPVYHSTIGTRSRKRTTKNFAANNHTHSSGGIDSANISVEKERQQSRFIRYYAALLIPWYPGWRSDADPSEIGSALYYFTTTAFIKVLDTYSDPDEPVLHRALFYLYKNSTTNMNALKITRLGSQIWRSRAADDWAAMNPADVPVPAQPVREHGGGEFNQENPAAAIAILNALDTAVNAGSEPAYMKARS